MDLETIEVCWVTLQKYIKSSDYGHAISHLVSELLDSGLRDEDLDRLADLDSFFANAVADSLADSDTDEWSDYDNE